MVQAKNGTLILIMALVLIASIGMPMYAISQIPEAPVIPTIPTAQQIADLIIVEIPTIDMPKTFLGERDNLKSDALAVCNSEFDFDEVEDLFDSDDEVKYTREYTDKIKYSNIRLGLDNEDDREITIEQVFKIAVEEDDGDDYNDKVYVVCDVTSDDGDLEAELSYTL